MESDSDHESSTNGCRPLDCLSPTILSELEYLDLTGRVVFKEKKIVSAGAYGDICKGWLSSAHRGRVRVAVKRLRFYLKEDIKALFEKEVYVWAKLDHSNVLPLLGYTFDNSTGYPLLVSEWMKNGSAWQFVRSRSDCDITRLVTGIARGLSYLHEQGIVHSDVKSDNVLVSDDENALICDFGCSRMVTGSRTWANVSTGVKGTPQYLAYELIVDSTSRHSKATDVWAFGMTVYELLAQERPYAHLPYGQVITAIMKHELPSLPAELPPSTNSEQASQMLWRLCEGCWKSDPSRRLDAKQIVAYLESIASSSLAKSSATDDSAQRLILDVANISMADSFSDTRPPTSLNDNDLDRTSVELLGSGLRADAGAGEVMAVVFRVHVEGKKSWKVDKAYSAFVNLDTLLHNNHSPQETGRLAALPEEKLFDSHLPKDVDERNTRLQRFLQSLTDLSIHDKSAIIHFLSSDVVPENGLVSQEKEGYLTMRGENYRTYRTCYFELHGALLIYYTSRGGAQLGFIPLRGCKVSALASWNNDNDEFRIRHALLIVESANGLKDREKQHVLCALSAKERDAWKEILLRRIR